MTREGGFTGVLAGGAGYSSERKPTIENLDLQQRSEKKKFLRIREVPEKERKKDGKQWKKQRREKASHGPSYRKNEAYGRADR